MLCSFNGVLQVNTELICDISFNQKYPDVLVTSGKEHLQWWKIYPESRTLQQVAQPQYDVRSQ